MKQKIVICDDEQDILNITQLILEDAGFTVIPVSDSLTVEAVVAAEKPELLLIDLWMPGLSGDQVVASIRNNETLSDLPVIVISASRDGEKVAYASGADCFLEKPYDIDSLVNLVRKQLAA